MRWFIHSVACQGFFEKLHERIFIANFLWIEKSRNFSLLVCQKLCANDQSLIQRVFFFALVVVKNINNSLSSLVTTRSYFWLLSFLSLDSQWIIEHDFDIQQFYFGILSQRKNHSLDDDKEEYAQEHNRFETL